MFLFNDELKSLIASVHDRTSVQVIARWGVGLSSLLRAVSQQLRNEDYAVILIEGKPYARHIEYYPLIQSGVVHGESAEPRTFAALVDHVRGFLGSRGAGVVIIDGVEHVDRGTLAVLQAATDAMRSPVVAGRSRDIRSLIAGGTSFFRFSGQRIELKPLDFIGTAALLHDRLGHWPDAEVASRVFAKSGGVTGLATAIITGANTNGLIRLEDDRWTMAGTDLHSGEADSWIEAHLSLLSPPEYDALEHVAMGRREVRDGDHPDPESPALRSLDGLGLLTVIPHIGTRRVAAHPPILADYLRRSLETPLSRLAIRSADDWLGDGGAAEAHTPSGADSAELSVSVMAFRRTLEVHLLEHAKRWSATPTVAAAIPYLVALTDTPRAERTVEAVFSKTALTTALSAESAFDFVYVYHLWSAGKLSQSNPELSYAHVSRLFPEWEPTIAAHRSIWRDGPSVGERLFTSDRPDSFPGQDLMAATLAYSHLFRRNIPEAKRWLARVSPSSHVIADGLRVLVDAMLPVAGRDYLRGVVTSEIHIERAHRTLDHRSLMIYSYSKALSLMALSRWDEANTVVTRALAFGPPGTVNGSIYRALLYIGAFAALWLNDPRLADRLTSEAERLDVHEGKLPGMQQDFSLVLRSLVDGDTAHAMRLLRALATRLSESGNDLSAELTLNLALIVWPEAATLDQLERVLAKSDGRYNHRVHSIARQSFSDVRGAVAAARAFDGPADDPAALPFLTQILSGRVRQELEQGSAKSENLDDVMAELATHSSRPVNVRRSFGTAERARTPPLTTRERQVASLVRNHSNAAIAQRLSVSVRTVENHVRSAMKKHGAATRHELYDRMRLDDA